MKESFLTLCTFVVACGLVRCFIAGTSLEKHFSMVSGIIVLLIIVGGIREFDLKNITVPKIDTEQSESAYDELVISKATAIVEENISATVLSRYGLTCDAQVVLEEGDSAFSIKSVLISGIDEVGYIRLYLADYLSVEEDVISFA